MIPYMKIQSSVRFRPKHIAQWLTHFDVPGNKAYDLWQAPIIAMTKSAVSELRESVRCCPVAMLTVNLAIAHCSSFENLHSEQNAYCCPSRALTV